MKSKSISVLGQTSERSSCRLINLAFGHSDLQRSVQQCMKRLSVLFLLFALSIGFLWAQGAAEKPESTVPTPRDYGTINGRVTDPAHNAEGPDSRVGPPG
jgi:hypothetical protein